MEAITVDLQDIGWQGAHLTHVAQQRVNGPLGCIKYRKSY
jgi:hypothetical protein